MAEPREILDSWKEISDYLKRDARTCQRYERELGLPVHRLDGSPKARVFAYRDELDAWLVKKPSERSGGSIGGLLRFIQIYPLVAVAGTILILGLGVLLYRAATGRSAGPSRISIAVLPIQNASGQSDLDKWSVGIPQLLIQGLSGSNYFGVISDDRTTGVLRDLGIKTGDSYTAEDLRRFGARSGATHAIMGHILKAGDGLVLTLTTKDMKADKARLSRFECADEAALVPVSSRMADQVKRDLGLTRTVQSGDFDALAVPVTTSSLEAFRLYNEGRRLHLNREYSESVLIMRKAIRQDPQFALAWRSMGASLEGLGRLEESWDCMSKAVALSRNASMQEQFFIKSCFFQFKSEFRLALEVARDWISLFPEDLDAPLWLGRGNLFIEEVTGAREAMSGAFGRGNRNPFLIRFAAFACTALGEFEEADRMLERGLSLHPENPLLIGGEVINAIAQGQLDRALSLMAGRRDKAPFHITPFRTGDVLLLKDDFRGAEEQYRRVLPFDGDVKARLARLALSEGRYRRAAELANDARDHALLAYIEWRLGRAAEGRRAANTEITSPAGRSGDELGLSRLTNLQIRGALEVQAGDLNAAKSTLAMLYGERSKGFEKAIERASSWLNGLIAEAMGHSEQAAKYLEIAAGLLSRDVPYLDEHSMQIGALAETQALVLYSAGRQCESMGNWAAALTYYRRLIGLNGGRLQHPDLYALSHYAVGRIRQAQGDPEGARESFRKFLELWKNADPGLPEVEDAKKRLAAL